MVLGYRDWPMHRSLHQQEDPFLCQIPSEPSSAAHIHCRMFGQAYHSGIYSCGMFVVLEIRAAEIGCSTSDRLTAMPVCLNDDQPSRDLKPWVWSYIYNCNNLRGTFSYSSIVGTHHLSLLTSCVCSGIHGLAS